MPGNGWTYPILRCTKESVGQYTIPTRAQNGPLMQETGA